MKNKLLKTLSYYTLEELLNHFGPYKTEIGITKYKTKFVLEMGNEEIPSLSYLVLSDSITIEPHSHSKEDEVNFHDAAGRGHLFTLKDQFKITGENKFKLIKSFLIMPANWAPPLQTKGTNFKFYTLNPVNFEIYE